MTNEEIHEVAMKAVPENIHDGPVAKAKKNGKRYDFERGAQWAAERLYTKEDMIAFAEFHNAAWYEIPAELNFETWLKERESR